MMRRSLAAWILVLVSLAFSAAVHAQGPAPRVAPDPAAVGVEAATQAWLDTMSPGQKAKSDAYFEGGYWLLLWDFLWSAAVYLALLHSGASARVRDLSARLTGRRALQPAIYWIQFLLVTTVATFPLTVYSQFYRERAYGLGTQSFGAWMGDEAKGLVLGAVFGALLIVVLYVALRRAGRSWWLWAAGVVIAFSALGATVAPVYVAPMFNTYTRLSDSPIRTAILRLAHANGIAANDVWEVDASRQTTRVSANVSGMFGTERITLNDNLLERASPAAVEAVMGHEMGHYVLNHVYKLLLSMALVIAAGFALAGWAYPRLAAHYSGRWRVADIGDTAGLPLLALIVTTYFFIVTPLTNSLVRTSEYEADMFGLNASRQPDGFAEAAILLGDYRKLDPSPIEEMIFFDHPSGRTRIHAAMQWKASRVMDHNWKFKEQE